jgi:nitrate/nitrite transport system substrate-binding protein
MSENRSGKISRRLVLKSAAATAAMTGIGALASKPLYAATDTPETTKAILGFIALTDSAPLIVAKEKGLFAKHGMPDVEVVKQASWGTTRDNLVLGSAGNGIDGAHILTPMPYLMSTGKITQNNVPTPMHILSRLNLDGQGISIGAEYAGLKIGVDAKPFKAAIEKKKAAGNAVKAAMTGSPPAASIPTRTSRPSSFRRRKWSRT